MKNNFKKTALALVGTMIISSPLVLANESYEKNQKSVINVKSYETSNITQGKFTDFFPDKVLAQAVADRLNKNIWDNTTKEELSTIEHLSIYDNDSFKNIIGIENLSNLDYLDVYGENLDYIPDSIGQLSKLTTFFVTSKSLNSLPDSIGNLSKLEYLSVMDCNMTEVPDTLANLHNLKQMFFDGNELTEIPDFISKIPTFPNELEVGFFDNKLTEVPDSLVQHLDNPNLYLDGDWTGIGQVASLDDKKFDSSYDLTLEDILPKFILQLESVYPQNIFGTLEITFADEKNIVKLEDILSNKVDLNDVFKEIGKYDVIIKTNDSSSPTAKHNTKDHIYDYSLEIINSK